MCKDDSEGSLVGRARVCAGRARRCWARARRCAAAACGAARAPAAARCAPPTAPCPPRPPPPTTCATYSARPPAAAPTPTSDCRPPAPTVTCVVSVRVCPCRAVSTRVCAAGPSDACVPLPGSTRGGDRFRRGVVRRLATGNLVK